MHASVRSGSSPCSSLETRGLDVARYTVAHLARLETETRLFQTTLFSSTLPGCVLEAVASNLAVLRSPTVIRYPDGTLYGWEGCTTARRLGYGTCNHVWNYQHAVPFLFPRLQRSMLENAYFNGMREADGAIAFRVPAGPGNRPERFKAAADGQLGVVCQTYREWLISGDTDWLRTVWPSVQRSLEYAWQGCISEQVHGQLYVRMLGLDDIYEPDHIHTALESLFRHNFCENVYDHINTARAYSVGRDHGLLIAAWPRGGRPEHPLLYCDETQAGYEYQVAINLLYEGLLHGGLAVIKAVRDRYDGNRRNPYCEFEWGNHYARSMASYAALLAIARFRYVGAEQMIGIDPQLAVENFRVFFSVEGAWGTIAQRIEHDQAQYTVDVAMGSLPLAKLSFRSTSGDPHPLAFLGELPVEARCTVDGNAAVIALGSTVTVRPGQPLRVTVKRGAAGYR